MSLHASEPPAVSERTFTGEVHVKRRVDVPNVPASNNSVIQAEVTRFVTGRGRPFQVTVYGLCSE